MTGLVSIPNGAADSFRSRPFELTMLLVVTARSRGTAARWAAPEDVLIRIAHGRSVPPGPARDCRAGGAAANSI